MTDEKQIDGTTHAEKDANGDIVHKPNVVDTDDVTINDVLDATGLSVANGGSETQWLTFEASDSTILESKETYLPAVAGDNSANSIFDVENGYLLILGKSSDGDWFNDILNVATATDITVVDATTRGSPGSRSYSRSGSTLQVAIDDSGVSYNIAVRYTGATIASP